MIFCEEVGAVGEEVDVEVGLVDDKPRSESSTPCAFICPMFDSWRAWNPPESGNCFSTSRSSTARSQ